jgi:hypothetical protein
MIYAVGTIRAPEPNARIVPSSSHEIVHDRILAGLDPRTNGMLNPYSVSRALLNV